MNAIERFEQAQIKKLTENKIIPSFKSGDTVKVSVRIVEGATERVQAFEGVVIARRNAGINSSMLIRKISHGCGVERRFIIYAPIVKKIEVIKQGIVKRAKLYYLRDRQGKAARIKEKITYKKKK